MTRHRLIHVPAFLFAGAAAIPGLEYTASNMLHRVTYHGGQIAVLKRALAGSAR